MKQLARYNQTLHRARSIYIPIPRPALGAPTTGHVALAASRFRAVRRTSAAAARTESCIDNSGEPRCGDCTGHPRVTGSVRATTLASSCTRPRVRTS